MKNPNILLIVMDAVRTHNMSIFGYEKETTPMLKRILSDCAFYKNAISSSYWTLPSYASTFTSTYVSRHGLVVNGDVLDKEFITMAEMLRAIGYKTIGICPSPYVSEFSGLQRGFEIFRDPANTSFRSRWYRRLNRGVLHTLEEVREERVAKKDYERLNRFAKAKLEIFKQSDIFKRFLWKLTGLFDKYAKATNDLAFNLIEKAKEPFFVFIHYNETHTPYILPEMFRERFLSSVQEKKLWDVNQDFFKYYSGEAKMTQLDFSILKAFYDGAISYLDTRIFEIYSFLQKRELLDNTMVIITSDHGDSFGEHEIFFHAFCLYDTLIKIPLIIKYPVDLGIRGIENRMVQNTDLLPTIMDILRLDNRRLRDQIQGNSLLNSNIGSRDYTYAISELVKPFGPRIRSLRGKLGKFNRQLISIRTENKKYIYASDGNHEFYNLQDDPNENNNLVNSPDPAITELREKLKPWLGPFHDCCKKIQQKIDQAKKEVEFKTEIKQRLRDLGYL